TKPGLEKVWALRIKKGCASILTQPHGIYYTTELELKHLSFFACYSIYFPLIIENIPLLLFYLMIVIS
ncbi:hypothetical protein, partial [uncultured Bacteroides sp.]|uniref:hypothetical protein n=1 Tax=uncultured Bacteroides sp. TaxID=162156 RepID=UPI00259A4A8B